MKVEFKKLYEDAQVPKYQTEGSACADMYVYIDDPNFKYDFVRAGETKIVRTGIAVAIPSGWEIQIRPRSGLAAQGLVVANSPGTIDSDYRGEIGILLRNNTPFPIKITHGDRIAQCTLQKVTPIEFVEVTELSTTIRGEGGYGHTGMR